MSKIIKSSFTALVKEDSESGDFYIDLDEEMCKSLDWNIGDTIIWEKNGENSYVLVKKTVDSNK
jgi:hypothetical protein